LKILPTETASIYIDQCSNSAPLIPCHPERHRATEERGRVEGPRGAESDYTASGSSHQTPYPLHARRSPLQQPIGLSISRGDSDLFYSGKVLKPRA